MCETSFSILRLRLSVPSLNFWHLDWDFKTWYQIWDVRDQFFHIETETQCTQPQFLTLRLWLLNLVSNIETETLWIGKKNWDWYLDFCLRQRPSLVYNIETDNCILRLRLRLFHCGLKIWDWYWEFLQLVSKLETGLETTLVSVSVLRPKSCSSLILENIKCGINC